MAWESLFQGGSLLESEGFPVPFTGAKFSFSSEKFSFESTGILFSGIQNVQRGALSSAVDMPESLSYLTPYGLEQVWTNLMISTPVDSFCSNLWFRVHEREFYLHHLLLRALCAGLCSLKTVCEDLLHGSVIELDRLHILCRALSFSIASP